MRVVGDLEGEEFERVRSLVITGDGRGEFRRLGYISPRYDGDDLLHFPSRPERHLSITGKQTSPGHKSQTGLSALEALKVFKGKFGFTDFLYLVDMEHLEGDSNAEFEADLNDKLEEVSTGSVSMETLSDGAFRCELTIGSREIVVLAAVIGDEFECFEDGLAKLLLSEWGNPIDASSRKDLKRQITEILSNGQERDLIQEANDYALEEAFPNLTAVMKQY